MTAENKINIVKMEENEAMCEKFFPSSEWSFIRRKNINYWGALTEFEESGIELVISYKNGIYEYVLGIKDNHLGYTNLSDLLKDVKATLKKTIKDLQKDLD
jgi:hypothetical protein